MNSGRSLIVPLCAVLLGIGWLLPNHYLPWTAFHSEAWVAVVLLATVPICFFKAPESFPIDRLVVWLALAAVVPFLQFGFDQISYFGHAWICSLFLLGLLLSVLAGRLFGVAFDVHWLVDMLSLAVGAGAICSVALQLYQWLELDALGIWLMEANVRRPAANLGQPNQLATLLLWGGLASFWGWVRNGISGWLAIFIAMFVLFGVALTGSRTAWIATLIVILCVFQWKKLWKSKATAWVIAGLGGYYVLCVMTLMFFVKTSRVAHLVTLTSESLPRSPRWSAWVTLISAALDKPLFGYGWEQVAEAHLSVALEHPPLHTVFSRSHNLFLDLILWCGLPIGLLFSFILVRFLFLQFRKIKCQEQAVLILFLAVVATHAMFEYPLHYVYFLLPTGLLVGALLAYDDSTARKIVVRRNYVVVLWMLCVAMLAVTLSDYLRIEQSYRILRMEWAGFNLERNPQPPRVLVLTQWHHVIEKAREVPRVGMNNAEIEDMQRVAVFAHKPLDFRNLAKSLALNGRPREGEMWVERLCSVDRPKNCRLAREEFAQVLKEGL